VTTSEAGDPQLLQLSAAGDAAAFARFVDRHQGVVYRRARAACASAADAEDVLQETFLAAWRGAAGFRGTTDGDARGWLLTIARHACHRMSTRSSARISAAASDVSLESLALRAGWGAVPDEQDDDRATRVRAAFATLAHEDREILALRDIEETSGEEAARMLGLTLAAMKSRLHRARLRLAAAYAEDGGGSHGSTR
jgi:RNA polymerase sigma-70 factor (ECF subfamily)